MINFCQKCHSIVNDGAIFCTKCGVNILDFNEQREVPRNIETTEVPQPLQQAPLPQEKNKKANATPTKANPPKTYFSAISAFFIIAGAINIAAGISEINTSVISAFAFSSGLSSILTGVILMKVDEILWDFRNKK